MTLRYISSSIATVLSAWVILMLLMTAVTPSQVAAQPGTLNHFSSGKTSIEIGFTEFYGEDDTSISIDLPKRSNVLGVNVDLNGSILDGLTYEVNVSSVEDWSKGNLTPEDYMVRDDDGFHLNVSGVHMFELEKKIETGSK